MHKGFWIYILASGYNGTLYIGCTDDLPKRIEEHKSGKGGQFTSKYKVNLLVYAEHQQFWETAFQRETQLKKWKRAWKIELIEKSNPEWRELNANM